MNPILNEYKNLAEFLKNSLGNLYDVLVFEFDGNKLKIIENAYINDENIEKIIPFVLKAVNDKKKVIVNQALEVSNGKLIKISIHIIADAMDNVIGAMCVSLHCNPFLKLERLVNEFLNFKETNGELNEIYPSTIEGIEKYFDNYSMASNKPTKAEKTDIIIDLYDMGMFNIKGAVAKVADRLSMSTKSVYRYISKIKENRE